MEQRFQSKMVLFLSMVHLTTWRQGSTNEYFTTARAHRAIQADPQSGNLLQYFDQGGDLLVSTSAVRGVFSGGTAISINNGAIGFTGTSDLFKKEIQMNTSHLSVHAVH